MNEAIKGIREAWTFKARFRHLAMKIISFKGLAWIVATYLFHVDKLSGELWVVLTTSMAGLNTYGKHQHRKHLRQLDNDNGFSD